MAYNLYWFNTPHNYRQQHKQINATVTVQTIPTTTFTATIKIVIANIDRAASAKADHIDNEFIVSEVVVEVNEGLDIVIELSRYELAQLIEGDV